MFTPLASAFVSIVSLPFLRVTLVDGLLALGALFQTIFAITSPR